MGPSLIALNLSLATHTLGTGVLDEPTLHLLHIKVGFTTDPSIRLNTWRKQCTSREGVILGCWPVSKKPSSRLYTEIRGGPKKVPFVRRAEHLIHLELADVACYHPILGSCALVGGNLILASTCLIVEICSLRKGALWPSMLKGLFLVSFVLVSIEFVWSFSCSKFLRGRRQKA